MLGTELTEWKPDSVAGGSLEEFLRDMDMASWDLDLPPDIPPPVQPKLEGAVIGEIVEPPLPVYGKKTMNLMQQPVDQSYQVAGSWPQPPHQITPHLRSSHVGNGRMRLIPAGPPPHQQYNNMPQGGAGLTHIPMEVRNHIPPRQPCARQAVVPFGNMPPCQQREVQGPVHYLQHRPPMINPAVQASQVRTMSPGIQRSVMPSQTAMMSASPMSNQLHNLQVMVNNQTNMMHRSHVNISPGLGPNGSGGLPDPLMHGKVHRNTTRMMHGSRHNGMANDTRVFQTSEYLSQPNIMRQSQAQLPDQSVNMVAHPAAAGFHNQSSVAPLQHGITHGQTGPVVQQGHPMPNHSGMVVHHSSMMPTQPELRPNQFSGRSHGMGVMSPVHRGMVHPSGVPHSQMGIPGQQMMMLKQQPVQMQLSDRMMPQQSEVMSDKTGAAFQWLPSRSTPNVMVQPAGVQNVVTQARNSPAVNQFPPTVSPTTGNIGGLGAQNNTPFTGDIDSLSFLSDQFLSQVTDDGYCTQQQILQPSSTAGTKYIFTVNHLSWCSKLQRVQPGSQLYLRLQIH